VNDRFYGSRLKIERAKEHIENLNSILQTFLQSDFYRISIEQDFDGANFIQFDVDTSKFPRDSCALIIGDVLHNLRSALDTFVYVIHPWEWSNFPISDTREKLISRLSERLKQKQISETLSKFILDTVKPYETGNYELWVLHHLNNWDKHQLLIPVIQGMQFHEVSLEDDKQVPINRRNYYFSTNSFRLRLDGTEGRSITLKDKGHATAQIFFNFGGRVQNEAVIPTLHRIAIVVTRTIEAVDLLGV